MVLGYFYAFITGMDSSGGFELRKKPVNMPIVGHGGALVEAITLNRRVVGSTPALAAM